MDLKALKPVESLKGIPCTLTNPTDNTPLLNDEGKAMTVYVVGEDSKEYQQAVHRSMDRTLKTSQSRRKMVLSSEQIAQDQIELLVACTKGWESIQLDGSIVTFSQDAARNLYKDFTWIADQVRAFIEERANFLGNLSKNS